MILAAIDHAVLVTTLKKYEGKLSLVREDDYFYLDFSSNNPSKVNCSNIKEIHITESTKENIMIIIIFTNTEVPNSFEFCRKQILDVSDILLGGIARNSFRFALHCKIAGYEYGAWRSQRDKVKAQNVGHNPLHGVYFSRRLRGEYNV